MRLDTLDGAGASKARICRVRVLTVPHDFRMSGQCHVFGIEN